MLQYLKATERYKSGWGHRRDKDATRHLRAHFGNCELSELNAAAVRAYMAKRMEHGLSNSTINRELSVLSTAINYARREWDWDVQNPVSGRKLREPEGRTRWITRAEAQGLIAAAEEARDAPHLADFIRLALHTGCRKGELLGLEWCRVDLQANLIRLEAEHTKTRRRRSIPVNRDARAALLRRARFRAEHCPASPWVFAHRSGARIQDLKRSFMSACGRAGIEDFRIHDLRHTCAAWLVTGGVPLAEVRDVLGHSTVMMTERYAHLAPENLRVAVTVLEGKSQFGHSGAHREEAVTP
jgi:integrase